MYQCRRAIGALFLLGLGFFVVKALQWEKKVAPTEQIKVSEWKYEQTEEPAV